MTLVAGLPSRPGLPGLDGTGLALEEDVDPLISSRSRECYRGEASVVFP